MVLILKKTINTLEDHQNIFSTIKVEKFQNGFDHFNTSHIMDLTKTSTGKYIYDFDELRDYLADQINNNIIEGKVFDDELSGEVHDVHIYRLTNAGEDFLNSLN